VVTSSLLGLIVNYLDPKGISLIREDRVINWAGDSTGIDEQEQTTIDGFKKNLNDNSTEPAAITLKQAYKFYNEKVLFIDARDFVEYEIGHIKGAINLPYNEFDMYKSNLDAISKNTAIVAYCDGQECDLSILLSDKLFELGYSQVYIFWGGWIDWQLANYPIESDE